MMNVTQLMLGINIVVAVVRSPFDSGQKRGRTLANEHTKPGLAHPRRQSDLKHLHNNALDIAPDPDIEYLIQEIAKLP